MTAHGTWSRYAGGCRCPACTAALPHGTTTGYNGWGCRCADCTAANSAYVRVWRARRRSADRRPRQAYPDGPPHGTRARYARGCRCPACKAANTATVRAWRARGQAVRGLGWPA